MQFRMFFEFYGKKMQTIVEAGNQQDAEDCIRSEIIFHKVERIKKDNVVDELKKIFGMVK